MTITRIRIPLEQKEMNALFRVAVHELRNPENQALLIIRRELERLGYLEPQSHGRQHAAEEPAAMPEPGR